MRNPCSHFWLNRSVFLTGHTGFKGGWTALWLAHLGARVHGYSLLPPTKPSFFEVAEIENMLETSTIGDIRDMNNLSKAMRAASPSVVIHMAAQSLVRESYKSPVDTFATNMMGTVNLLEVSRQSEGIRAIVNVTTDKCYDIKEWVWPYREDDSLGGHDPYSSSKACAELASAAYRASFLSAGGIHLATARSGNVIGGGDWAADRLIPDFFRALAKGKTVRIRSPSAVRPWQHVLEPIAGYLLLVEQLVNHGASYANAWNFGPEQYDTKTVSWVVDRLCASFPESSWEIDTTSKPHEASTLKLDNTKAKLKLQWSPRWPLETAINETIKWRNAWRNGSSMSAYSWQQIQAYQTS